jgi:hypothetical protein
MTSFRVVVTLVLALTLGFAASAAAQSPVGPICLQPMLEGGQPGGVLEIFALPMGGTTNGSQFLLSAISGSLPFSGAASLVGQQARFTLMAALSAGALGAVGTFSGVLDFEAGTGVGACSTIDSTVMEPTCGTNTPVTYALVSCD